METSVHASSGAMRANEAKVLWVGVGALVLAALCSLLVLSGRMSPLVPMPIHQVLLAWTTGVGFLVALPTIYIATLLWLWNKKSLGVIVLVVSLVLAVLSAAYFVNAWSYGIRFQGVAHTRIVAAENAIGLAVVLSLALIGLRTGAKTIQLAAYFLVFAMLSWCAFPYLGELP